ncbi:MAG: hypothetical protein HRU19_12095 [Pseudobacteriovorax sp.]|nr:hypothetical protein [Pseudobacteriovorax sp.]
MNVMTFEASTMKDAIKKVKSEFGSDAVILDTKERNAPDRGKWFEVTATPSGVPGSRELGASKSSGGYSISPDELINWQKKLDSFEDRLKEIKQNALQREHLFRVESSIEEIRVLIVDYLTRKVDAAAHGLTEPMANIVNQIKVMQINQTTVSKLAKFLKSLPAEPSNNEDIFEFYQRHAIKWFMKRIKIAQKWENGDELPVRILVGPSGVGKSTIAAKIAYYLSRQDRGKTLLVNFDKKRLGAAEQSRLYAKVLDLSFERITEAYELKQVIESHNDISSVIVDTGGRSPKRMDEITELMEFEKLRLNHSYHLVQSMTDNKSQMERSVRAFQKLGITSLLFTKMDESWIYGDVFNISDKWRIPLSWFSVGQGIPDDLEMASRERLVERIIGV